MQNATVKFLIILVSLSMVTVLTANVLAGTPTCFQKRSYELMTSNNGTRVLSSTACQQQKLAALSMLYGNSDWPTVEDFANVLRNSKALTVYRKTSDTSYNWQTDHWGNDTRGSYTYQGTTTKTTSGIFQSWDPDSVKWLNSSEFTYSYGANGKPDTTIFSVWIDDAWLGYFRQAFAYDISGQLLTSTTQNWNIFLSQWDNSSRATAKYVSGHVDTTLTETWTGSAWANSSRIIYTYDGSFNITHVLFQSWSGSAWVNSNQINSFYNGSNQATESIHQNWVSSAWVDMARDTYGYDGSGNQILDIRYSPPSPWTPIEADTFKYDGSNRNTEEIDYDLQTLALTGSDYTYDAHGNMILDLETQKPAAGSWTNVSRSVFVYEAALAVRDNAAPIPHDYALMQNYPNPFNPSTTISYRLLKRADVKISVYNVLGQQVKLLEDENQPAGSYHTIWDGTDALGHQVASGIYYYRINTNDFVETRKMILLR